MSCPYLHTITESYCELSDLACDGQNFEDCDLYQNDEEELDEICNYFAS